MYSFLDVLVAVGVVAVTDVLVAEGVFVVVGVLMPLRVRVCLCVFVCACVWILYRQKCGTLHRPLSEALAVVAEVPAYTIIQVSGHACGGNSSGRGLGRSHVGYNEGQDSG